jgi:hypothetical protein
MTAGEIIGRDIRPDKPNSPCAACGHIQLSEMRGLVAPINIAGSRVPVKPQNSQPTMLMLCLNAAACCARYRRGATPAVYAAKLRKEVSIHG